jgi:hypothetical protein
MKVRMEPQFARPGVQHGGDAWLCVMAQPLRVGSQGQCSRSRRFEQQVENRGSVVEGETV